MILGGCHCGNFRFELDWEGESPEIPARVCDCSFCVKHGGTWTSNPKAKLAVTVRDESLHTKYEFGTKTAEFHVCARCGIVPVATSRIDDHLYAVVNVNTFENVPAEKFSRAPASFGGEEVEGRLARRTRNWIGDVRFVERKQVFPG